MWNIAFALVQIVLTYLKCARRFACVTCHISTNCDVIFSLPNEPARFKGRRNIFLKNSSRLIASRDRDIACKISLRTHRSSRSWYSMSQYIANLCVYCAISFLLFFSLFFFFYEKSRSYSDLWMFTVIVRHELRLIVRYNLNVAKEKWRRIRIEVAA